MKKIAQIGFAFALVAVCGVGGHFAYKKWQQMKEAEVACVAAVFPYYLIEHNQDSIVNALRDLEDHDSQSEDPRAVHPPFLSKNIESRFAKISEGLRDDEIEASSRQPLNLPQEFRRLVVLFRDEAPAYLSECVDLFGDIFKKCGHEGATSEPAQSCMQHYQSEIQNLVSHYTNIPAVK